MILWPDEPLAVLDLETTGTDTATALPVQIACGILADHVQTPGGLHLDNGVCTFLVNPGIPIPDEAAAIHGIHDEDVADAPDPVEALSATLAMLHSFAAAGRPVVAYNARYDLTILKRLCDEHGGTWPTVNVIDPMVIDRHLDKWRKGRRTLTASATTTASSSTATRTTRVPTRWRQGGSRSLSPTATRSCGARRRRRCTGRRSSGTRSGGSGSTTTSHGSMKRPSS
jgi:DNA polymerase III epsilon subunit-like protein